MEPPNDLQRNCTVSPRAESRSLACFILANRGQASRLTSTSPVQPVQCGYSQRHILFAKAEAIASLNLSTDEASCAPPPSLKEIMQCSLLSQR
jgi:hypothetical protein